MRERGFTYVALLIAVALAAAVLGVVGSLWSTDAKREREVELLFVGDQFRRAIGSYYEQAPAGQPHRFPARLEDLVQDRRWPTVRRHLRKIYLDPITGTRDWGLVRAADNTIIGVHSTSDAVPLKRANFDDEYDRFADARTYRDWRFIFTQQGKSGR
jgi:type II secretory pathway pseudopilin PulG